ncbi:helix-turn-helix domain-containing protein [Erythrobacter tepidarius]|uniref:helix-turn-helix domain-containing protein n=1 Tax=Erythrobacter tepidarius TaxID=60454 RepID=UPI000A35DD39|nr:helix-turn-helix domain-containing protein [Erythrobacter tepidarius]
MAIKAHLDQPAAGDGQRGTPRRALRLETSGMLPDGREANVTIHNISTAGLLIETGLQLARGEMLTLDLPQAGAVEAVVAWRSGRLHGCAFATPLGAGALAAAQLQGLPVGELSSAATPVARSGQSSGGEALGVRLNRLRREAGMTLADVALRLGVSKPTVWAWEKGKARPLPERIAALAEVLGAAPEELTEAGGKDADTAALIAECRNRIAAACGTAPEAVRIMIEL